MSAILILTNCSRIENAKLIAQTLVSKKLAACVSISSSITSIYSWKNNIEETPEYTLSIKTTKFNYMDIENTIKTLHDYELPEIIALDIIIGSHEYLSWINDETIAINI